MVEYIKKCTGQFLKDLMSIPSNAFYYRLIRIDYKIYFHQCVQMLESICRYAVKKVRMSPTFVVNFILYDLARWNLFQFHEFQPVKAGSTISSFIHHFYPIDNNSIKLSSSPVIFQISPRIYTKVFQPRSILG